MRSHFSSFSLLALSFFFFACSAVETEDAVSERMATAMGEGSTGVPEQFRSAGASSAIEVNWIRLFQSEQLQALVDEAQANNRDLQAAAAGVERARALAIKAGAALKPSLAVGASGGGGGLFEGTTASEDFGLSAQVSWELDIWGKLAAGRRGAEATAEAVEADLKYARQSIAATTAKSYFVALESSLQEALTEENIETLEEVSRIVQVQYDNGLANAQDLALSKSDLAVARSQLEETRLARRDALRALELLLGRYPGAELELAGQMPRLPEPPPAGLPSELLERRPDLVAAERRVAVAFEETARARAARLPSLSLTGSLGGSSADLSQVLSPGNLAWQAAGNLLAPIFDGGARAADLAAATAGQQQAVASYAQTALEAFRDVETFLDQGSSLARRAEQINLASDEASSALRIAKLRHEEGEAPLLDVLTVQQRVAARKSQAIYLRRLQLAQRVNLFLSLGGDW
jgi:NodT family efflux transporter outer membrane factor (OMF) lipoprotein